MEASSQKTEIPTSIRDLRSKEILISTYLTVENTTKNHPFNTEIGILEGYRKCRHTSYIFSFISVILPLYMRIKLWLGEYTENSNEKHKVDEMYQSN